MTASLARIRLAEALYNDISGTYGGFPIRFLLFMTKLSKLIALKRQYVCKLKEMNSDVELLQPFRKRYLENSKKVMRLLCCSWRR